MRKLRVLIETAFDEEEFMEALIGSIEDHIDYHEVADMVLDAYQQGITDIAAEIAAEILA